MLLRHHRVDSRLISTLHTATENEIQKGTLKWSHQSHSVCSKYRFGNPPSFLFAQKQQPLIIFPGQERKKQIPMLNSTIWSWFPAKGEILKTKVDEKPELTITEAAWAFPRFRYPCDVTSWEEFEPPIVAYSFPLSIVSQKRYGRQSITICLFLEAHFRMGVSALRIWKNQRQRWPESQSDLQKERHWGEDGNRRGEDGGGVRIVSQSNSRLRKRIAAPNGRLFSIFRGMKFFISPVNSQIAFR